LLLIEFRKSSASGSIERRATGKAFIISGSDYSQLCEKGRKIFSTMRKAARLSTKNHGYSLA
jgi:hypothetical protein